ncbi:MAG: copper homeostasis periplasmic binding protein CopC [Sphingomicrobium sp.]
MKFPRFLLAMSAFTLAATSTGAIAHPKLVSSNPAANSTVKKPTSITLTFNEKLIAAAAKVDLTMTSMPGMGGHKPMKVTGFKSSVAADGKTLVLSLPRPLPAGGYKLDWHAVGGDTHPIHGGLTFNVR